MLPLVAALAGLHAVFIATPVTANQVDPGSRLGAQTVILERNSAIPRNARTAILREAPSVSPNDKRSTISRSGEAVLHDASTARPAILERDAALSPGAQTAMVERCATIRRGAPCAISRPGEAFLHDASNARTAILERDATIPRNAQTAILERDAAIQPDAQTAPLERGAAIPRGAPAAISRPGEAVSHDASNARTAILERDAMISRNAQTATRKPGATIWPVAQTAILRGAKIPRNVQIAVLGRGEADPHDSSVTHVAKAEGGAAIPHNAQTAIVKRYLTDLQTVKFDDAFSLLNGSARAYFRSVENLRSIYAADAYRIQRFTLVAVRGDRRGSVYFARETASYRDHAHDVDLQVTATVPVGVIPEARGWRIKDPGHPWRAFAARASSKSNGLRVTVKKMSFFARRIEAVVTFANLGDAFVTLLPYGKSILRDAAGNPYRIIETRNWSLTDKTLFEGLRLAPNAQYTGTLAFACEPLDNTHRTFSLTVGPLLVDHADVPFAIDVNAIAWNNPTAAAQK